MRIGQTSFVVFLSKLLGSVLGFLATLYFARILGAEIIGYYAVVLAVVSWLKLGGTLGVSGAVVKRVSEGKDPSAYFTAGISVVVAFGVILSLGVVIFSDIVDTYVGVEVWQFVVLLLLTGLFTSLVQSTLKGEKKVHIAGILSPTNLTVSSITQVGLVFAGLGLTGMLLGYLVGELVVGFLGALLLSVGVQRPGRRHFRRLFDFAKYSWIGGLKTRSFNDVDILVLGALVPSTLVGVYAVAWSIAKFLSLFGNAIRNTMFPEISHADASGEYEKISKLTTDSIAFIGLIAIPGLFGGVVLADRLLRIYGNEFTQGTAVLGLLILATLIFSYQQQMMGIIRAVDRPDLAFWINVAFILTNLVLNVVLVLRYGWVGAAVATVISAIVGLGLAFRMLRTLVDFDVPTGELGRQFGAATLMAVVVFACRWVVEATGLVRNNALLVVVLVAVGAGIYFLTLLAISRRFREIVATNSPVTVPFSM